MSKEEANVLRRYLKDESEFKGFAKTAKLIIQKSDKQKLKAKKLARECLKVFRLSEDYDSDSDCSDDDNKAYRKGRHHVIKMFGKSDLLKLEGDEQEQDDLKVTLA